MRAKINAMFESPIFLFTLAVGLIFFAGQNAEQGDWAWLVIDLVCGVVNLIFGAVTVRDRARAEG